MFQNLSGLTWDCSTEEFFRSWTGAVRAALLAAGLVKVYASAVPENLSMMRGTNQDSGGSYPPNNLYDNSTSSEWRSSAAPSSGAPIYLIYDAGVGSTFNCASMQIYTGANVADAAAITVDRSDDGVTWTNESISLSTLTNTTGYQTTNITTPSAHRFWRLGTTSTQGASGYVRFVEWKLWNTAGGTGTQATVAQVRPSGTNNVSLTEVWRMADTLQSTAPFFVKLEFGNYTAQAQAQMWLTFGTTHDGSGNLTGTQTSNRNGIFASATNYGGLYKTCFSGDTSRFSAALWTTASTGMWFHFERMGDASGADVNTGLMWFMGSSSQKYQGVVPTSGAVPSQENDFGLLPSTTGITLRGNNRRPVKFVPFLNGEELPARHIFVYFNAEYTTDTLYPNVTMAGVARQYYAVGQNLTSFSTRNGNCRLAIRGE